MEKIYPTFEEIPISSGQRKYTDFQRIMINFFRGRMKLIEEQITRNISRMVECMEEKPSDEEINGFIAGEVLKSIPTDQDKVQTSNDGGLDDIAIKVSDVMDRGKRTARKLNHTISLDAGEYRLYEFIKEQYEQTFPEGSFEQKFFKDSFFMTSKDHREYLRNNYPERGLSGSSSYCEYRNRMYDSFIKSVNDMVYDAKYLISIEELAEADW